MVGVFLLTTGIVVEWHAVCCLLNSCHNDDDKKNHSIYTNYYNGNNNNNRNFLSNATGTNDTEPLKQNADNFNATEEN